MTQVEKTTLVQMILNIEYQKRTKFVLLLLLDVMRLPAFFFHEMLHYLLAFTMGIKIKIADFHIMRVLKCGDSYNYSAYKMEIHYVCSSFSTICISIAPLIGWSTIMIVSTIMGWWFILAYAVLFWNVFYLSGTDIDMMRLNGLNAKICSVLYFFYDMGMIKYKNYK